MNLFLYGHKLANSFLLFRVHKCFSQMIKIYFSRHRLHFLLALSYGLQFLSTFPCTWKDLLASLRVHTRLDSSVSFLLFACRKDVKWFLYCSLKLVATESNVWFRCCSSRYSRLVNHVLSQAITVKKPECPLEGNCLHPTIKLQRTVEKSLDIIKIVTRWYTSRDHYWLTAWRQTKAFNRPFNDFSLF